MGISVEFSHHEGGPGQNEIDLRYADALTMADNIMTFRVPMYKPNKGQSTRVELRTIDAACNPYLAFAVVLAAGMKGIQEDYELPREAEDDVWTLSEKERKALGIQPLPKSLNEAIDIAENSELLAETLGEHVYDFFLRNKRTEWEEYPVQVSAFERDRMLPVL